MPDKDESRVDAELARLARSGAPNGRWPSESEIRRRAAQHHQRRIGATGLAALLLVVAIAITSAAIAGSGKTGGTGSTRSTLALGTTPTGPVSTGQGAHIGTAVELASLVKRISSLNSADESAVAKAEEEFGLKILRQLVNQSSTSNQLVSPFSLAEALAMAQLGARGQTATQLARALGLSNVPASEQALGWASLDEDLVGAASQDHIALRDANSVWTQKGFPVDAGFLAGLKSEFGAGVWQTDFDGDPTAAIDSVNAWVSQATDGRIPSLLQPDDVPSATAAILLNAVLFEAQWATQLTITQSGEFHSPGGEIPVTYMSPPGANNELLSSFGAGLDALQLPYWNGTGQGSRPSSRYAALLLMPTSGSLSQFVDSLDSSRLNEIMSSMTNQSVDPSLPESRINSDLQLVPALQALGVTDAFGPDADFSGLSSIATQISEVKQEATLRITKWGTVASAATAVVMVPTAIEAGNTPMIFNRPFLFLIRDTSTGAILFESAVNDPTGG